MCACGHWLVESDLSKIHNFMPQKPKPSVDFSFRKLFPFVLGSTLKPTTDAGENLECRKTYDDVEVQNPKGQQQCQPQIKPLETHPDAEPKKIVEIFSKFSVILHGRDEHD
jgi:hypothetical protein